MERLPLIDYRAIATDDKHRTVKLTKPGMRISLAAIAKGYAVDRAVAVLRENGLKDFIVFGGGDLFVSGRRGDRPWRVGIQDPRDRSRHFARFEADRDIAIVTTGDYEAFFVVDGERYHHVIDPATGYPARGTVSATVIAPTATLADALATGIFVLGPREGMALIESDRDLEGVIVDDHFSPMVSSGLRNLLVLTPIESTDRKKI